MIQQQPIECFHCKTPVDETDLDCNYCGGEVALELAERNAMAFLLRCTSFAVAGGGALAAVLVAFFLGGFVGHEKTFLLAFILTAAVAGLIWFAADWFMPTKFED